MGSKELAIFGGLLSGVGEGVLLKSRNRQKDEVDRRAAIIARLKEDRQFEHQRGLLSGTQIDEAGNVMGISRGGEVTDLGFKALPKASTSDSGRSAGDTRMIKDAERFATSTDSMTDEKVVDNAKVAAYLTTFGREDLAEPYANTSLDQNSDKFRKYRSDAIKWANEESGFWTSDKEDFKKYGGNKQQAIVEKTLEYYRLGEGDSEGQVGLSTSTSNDAGGSYSTAEDVRKAYSAGELTYAEAEKILRDKFEQI